MSRVQNMLANMFRHNLVQDIVRWEKQSFFVQQHSLRKQSIKIVRTHHVVFSSEIKQMIFNKNIQIFYGDMRYLLVCAATQEKSE